MFSPITKRNVADIANKNNTIDGFISYLISCKQKVITVYADKNIDQIIVEGQTIRINPFSEQAYQCLYDYLQKNQYRPSFITHAWAVTASDYIQGQDSINRQFSGFYSLFFIQKHLLNHFNHNMRLIVLINGITQISGRDIIHPEKGALLGAGKGNSYEMPHVEALCLDVGF